MEGVPTVSNFLIEISWLVTRFSKGTMEDRGFPNLPYKEKSVDVTCVKNRRNKESSEYHRNYQNTEKMGKDVETLFK